MTNNEREPFSSASEDHIALTGEKKADQQEHKEGGYYRNLARIALLASAFLGASNAGLMYEQQREHSRPEEIHKAMQTLESMNETDWSDEAGREPLFVLANIHKFVDEPFAEAVISKAAEQDPQSALFFAREYSPKPWARGIIEQAAARHPAAAVVFEDSYKALPDASMIAQRAASELQSSSDLHMQKLGKDYIAGKDDLGFDLPPGNKSIGNVTSPL